MKPPGTILKNFLTERQGKKNLIKAQNGPTPAREVIKDRWLIQRVMQEHAPQTRAPAPITYISAGRPS